MVRKNHNTDGLKNKKMNNDVYKLRRKVINIIYDLKNQGIDLPRIDVRITDNPDQGRALAKARYGTNQIWITDDAYDSNLYAIVLHEILHTVFNVPHMDGCRLMGVVVTKINKKDALNTFKQYVKTMSQIGSNNDQSVIA